MEHIKRVVSKGKEYLYFDTGQRDDKGKKIYTRLPDRHDKARFGVAHAAMLGHRHRREKLVSELTVTALVDQYQASPQFAKLKPATQKIYKIYQGQFVDQLGEGPAARVERKQIILMLDKMAAKPGACNMVVSSVSALYAWARKRDIVTNDPCRDIDPMEIGEHDPWPLELLEKGLATNDCRVRLLVHLLYYTGQRIGDVAKMRWEDIDDGRIYVKQQKRGRELYIPIHAKLLPELEKVRREEGEMVHSDGRKLTTATLRGNLQKFASDLGYTIVPHGLRKNAVNTLLESGCSIAETAAISGQSLQIVEHYAKRRNQKNLGDAAMGRWEGR